MITAPGVYEYRRLDNDEARAWIIAGEWTSTIGYPETAALAGELLGVEVPCDRRTIDMGPGDEGLVIRIVLPPGSPRIDPRDKGRLGEILRSKQIELGLLRRLA